MAEIKACPLTPEEAAEAYIAIFNMTPDTSEEGESLSLACKALAWIANRRTASENKPMTLEELRQMDGEPAYVQEGDGTEGWAVVCWDSPETLFLYGPEFDPVFEPDLDFINMEYNDPDGHFGLHVLGWRAYRYKPEEE